MYLISPNEPVAVADVGAVFNAESLYSPVKIKLPKASNTVVIVPSGAILTSPAPVPKNNPFVFDTLLTMSALVKLALSLKSIRVFAPLRIEKGNSFDLLVPI